MSFFNILSKLEACRSGRDALDIMLFDQYGNYVVQTMLDIAITVCDGKTCGNKNWLNRLRERILRYETRLSKYSSGKKLIAKIYELFNKETDENNCCK